jgi:eukaryotic-like serine/threonine-protein kinase
MTVPGGLQGLQIIQPLGGDRGVLVAADVSTGSRRLVLIERVTRSSPVPAARAELLRRGRALKALEHPKVVRVRDVFERDGDVLVLSDYVDGEWLASLMMMQPRPPLEVMLRLVVDVLEGLGALHDLRDENDQPIGFVHGGIAPDTVLVADDGVAEIARACRLPRAGTNERFVPPELRRGDTPAEPRADIYAAGAILRDILADAPADAKWAEPLTEIAWRACAVEPEDRWPSAAAMATTVRRIAGSRMATASVVADFVRRHFGARIRARRAALESADESAPPSSGEPISLGPSDMEVVEPISSSSMVTTLTPPPVVKKDAAIARISLVKKPSLSLALEDPAPRDRPPSKTTQLGLAPPPAPPPAPRPSTAATATPTEPGLQAAAPPRPSAAVAATTTQAGVGPAPASRQPAPPVAAEPPWTPPEVLVPIAAAPPAMEQPPPPTIVPDDGDPTAAYRRQLPTFPTFEEETPPKTRGGLLAFLVAGAMVLTFGLGWWLGRTSSPEMPSQAAPRQAAAPSTATPAVASLSATTNATASTATLGSVGASPSASTSAVVPSASVAAVPSTAPADAAPTAAAVTATATATTTVPAWMTAAPRPTPPAWTAAVTATAVAPRPTASATAAPPPKPPPPASSGGYVPSEL